jgi:hypothetical protein
MRIITPRFVATAFAFFLFTTACIHMSEAPSDNEDTVATMDSDIVHTHNAFLNRWVDRQYNVVCYGRSRDTLRCFPISDEGTVQYSLDFQNQTD